MPDSPRARLRVSPELLRSVLELPTDVVITGATMIDDFGRDVVMFDLDGEGVPDLQGGQVEADYTRKPKFDGFRPVREVTDGDPD